MTFPKLRYICPRNGNEARAQTQTQMEKLFRTLCAIAALSIAAQSCTTAKNTGNSYQQHLQHRHTGAHHLSNGNGGCNWHNN